MKNKRLLRTILISAIVIIVLLLLFLPRLSANPDDNKLKIVTADFPSYDIARALTDQLDVNLRMVIKPGIDLHDYDPTPQDIAAIQAADVFIYIGGESQTWVDKITFSDKTLTIKLSDSVKLISESDDTDELDEHIWTSPANYLNMLSFTRRKLAKHLPDYASQFSTYLSVYGEDIKAADQLYRNSKLIQPLIMADRFPFRYLANDYNLKYYAAFPGCAEQTEASAETIAKLIEATKTSHAPYIYILDMSSAKIAQTIKDATGAEIRTLYSGHNLSQTDFDAGTTMSDIYQHNLKMLQDAK